jgi:hypothetical protein
LNDVPVHHVRDGVVNNICLVSPNDCSMVSLLHYIWHMLRQIQALMDERHMLQVFDCYINIEIMIVYAYHIASSLAPNDIDHIAYTIDAHRLVAQV